MESRKRKVVFLGPEKAGKTVLTVKLRTDTFSPDYQPTVGLDYDSLHLPAENWRLQIWDTAGQQRFMSLVPNYVRDAHLLCFVYSVHNVSSLSRIDEYLKVYQEQALNPAPVCLLIANQTDLPDRFVSREMGEAYAAKNDMMYLEFSALADSKQALLDKVIEALEKWELTA